MSCDTKDILRTESSGSEEPKEMCMGARSVSPGTTPAFATWVILLYRVPIPLDSLSSRALIAATMRKPSWILKS